MLFAGFISWWYGYGLSLVFKKIRAWMTSMYDYFSIDLLLQTLFSPFRQISAGSMQGPIGAQMRALFDNLFSRAIGGFLRTFMIIFGVIALLVVAIRGVVYLVFWILAPTLPILGLILMLANFIPW